MILKKVFHFFVYAFAIAGFLLIAGFFAIRFGITNVSGTIDINNTRFESSAKKIEAESKLQKSPQVLGESTSSLTEEIDRLQKIKGVRSKNYCKIKAIGQYYPANAHSIIHAYQQSKSDSIVSKMLLAVEMNAENNQSLKDQLVACENVQIEADDDLGSLAQSFSSSQNRNVFSWIDTPDWQALKQAAAKDKETIDRVGKETEIEPRLIVSNMIVEQLRVFNSERQVFKSFFEPLKVLCSANKISLGVMGIKENTAQQVEENLKNISSPFYLGKEDENLLDFGSQNATQGRYGRLVDDKNHYYSYLYGALYLKQMMKQWKDARFDIQYRPEIVSTLFNVGFPQSKPKPDPKVGGSQIKVAGRSYSFGSLAYEFYYSGELADEFPYQVD